MTDVALPEELSFSEEDIIDASEERRLSKQGFYQCVITKKTNKVSKSGRFMLNLRCAPLKMRDDADSAQSRYGFSIFLVLPFVNPNAPEPEHSAEEEKEKVNIITENMIRDLNVLFGEQECPRYPHYDRAMKGLVWRGESISKDQVREARKETARIAMEKAKEVWAGSEKCMTEPSPIAFMALLKFNPESDFPDVNMYGDLPPDASLVPFEQWCDL